MPTIKTLLLAPANGAFFYDDQAAIKAGAQQDGLLYIGTPRTPGFRQIRQPADALSIGLVLSDGAVCWGDMVSVQYSGAAGREALFDRDRIAMYCLDRLLPTLKDRDARTAFATCGRFLDCNDAPVAVRYGASQALLRASAHAASRPMAAVVAHALDLPLPNRRVPIFAQSGDDRKLNVDKMILKAVDVLPHGLINAPGKFGEGGAVFLEYVAWVAERVASLGAPGYRPTLHFDLYGQVGMGIGQDPRDVADYIASAAHAAGGLALNIESPVDYGSRGAQIEKYAEIVKLLDGMGQPAKIVADEHCNTLTDVIEFCDAGAAHVVQIKTPDIGSLYDTALAIRYARDHGVGAYCGGTSAETDLSARACVHVALAAQASMMLAKPGMGVDEGLCIVGNEQSRALCHLEHLAGAGDA